MAEPSRAGFFAALRTLVATLVASGRTRLELLSVELQEEKLRVVDLLVCAFLTLFLIGFGLVLVVAFLAAAFWEQRLWVFGGSAAVALLLALGLVVRIRALTATPSPLFRTSLAELDKDLAALRAQVPADGA